MIDSKKIWDSAPHNAFTDLIRFRDRFICCFREAEAHVSDEGQIRLLCSPDGVEWEAGRAIRIDGRDLRDPKLSIAPSGELALSTFSVDRLGGAPGQNLLYRSTDAEHWVGPHEITQESLWLWRIQWFREKGYGFAYGQPGQEHVVRLFQLEPGNFEARSLYTRADAQYPNESCLHFDKDGTCRCLLRRDKGRSRALLGTSFPPYENWQWDELDRRIGGPVMRPYKGELLAVVRLYEGEIRTALCRLDVREKKLLELERFPSGQDCSYAGMLFHRERLWVSYYSGHEGRTAIYLAGLSEKELDRLIKG